MPTAVKVVYQARPGRGMNDDQAQVIGQELEMIRRKHKQLTPALVVEHARAEDSPLHGHFEWDDTKAAEEFRLHQARMVIRVVVVQMENRQQEHVLVPAFVNDCDPDDDSRAYPSVAQVLSEEDMRLRSARSVFMWFYSRRNEASLHPELQPIVDALDAVAPQFE